MTVRVLPHEEWGRLVGTELGPVWDRLDPTKTCVVVVEHDGEIVGTHALLETLHVEGLWIHPEHRGKSAVGRLLWPAVCRAAREKGFGSVVTHALTQTVADMAVTAGGDIVPGSICVIPVGGE